MTHKAHLTGEADLWCENAETQVYFDRQATQDGHLYDNWLRGFSTAMPALVMCACAVDGPINIRLLFTSQTGISEHPPQSADP